MEIESRPSPGAVALVTGAGGGIGARVAERIAGIGCRVICAGRRLERVEAVAAGLNGRGLGLALDVTDKESVESLVGRLPAGWKPVEVLVNNAGHDAGGRRAFHEGTAEQWADIIETNVAGLVRVTRALIGGMRERNRGHIVNIGSIAGMRPYATGTLYSASKHAVHGFSESLRLDYVDTGIRVTEIMPGMVKTDFAFNRSGDAAQAEKFYQDFGTSLDPDDVARSVIFALQQPAHVVISQLVVVPVSQR
ncbi:MAG TPA: SDR family oxidoreductase [Gammaproteobacteria bacterium]|nr:SDR family oxidoreductase [Gammaproteobacteria bacterium]